MIGGLAQLEEGKQNQLRFGLGAFCAVMLILAGFLYTKVGDRKSEFEARQREYEAKQKALSDLKGNGFVPIVEAIFKEDSTTSLARFGLTVSRLATENNVQVQKMATSPSFASLAPDPTKVKGPWMATRDVDMSFKGKMKDTYRLLVLLSSTRIPFKILNIDATRADKTSDPGSIITNVKVSVFVKGDSL